MPTLAPSQTPYYGGGQVINPANVIPTTGAPSSANIQNPGTFAVDNANANIYACVSISGGTATWDLLAGAAMGTFTGLTGDNAGTATPNNNITVAGTANQIATSGALHTLTLSLPAAITAPGSLTTTTTLTATAGNITATNGNLNLAHTGNKILIHATTAASDSIGTSVAMTAGSVIVSTTAVTANSKIFVNYNTPDANGSHLGWLSVPSASIIASTSFVINSSNSADTSTVNYWIIN